MVTFLTSLMDISMVVSSIVADEDDIVVVMDSLICAAILSTAGLDRDWTGKVPPARSSSLVGRRWDGTTSRPTWRTT